MSNRIEEKAQDSTIRAQVEEGVNEILGELGKDIPGNFKTVVDLITATVVEYGANTSDLSSLNGKIFTLFGAGASAISSGIFNFGISNDPWPKAIAKAIAGISYDVFGGFVGLGFKGIINVAVSYKTGNEMSSLVGSGYDILLGPDYEVVDAGKDSATKIEVDYTLKDALLIPEKLKDFLKAKDISGDWVLTDNQEKKLEYNSSGNTYSFSNISLENSLESTLIDGLMYYDSQGYLPIKVEFSDTNILELNPLFNPDNSEIASLSKSDGRVMWALNNLKPFYVENAGGRFWESPSDYSESYINDRALLLWLNNWVRKNKQEHYKNILDALYDPEGDINQYLRTIKTYIIDKKNGVEYGINYFGKVADHRVIEFGTNGDDRNFSYTKNDDRLYGADGDDTIKGGRGNDYIEGGIGEDTLYGGNGKDTLYGGENDDMIFGDDKNDEIYGDDGEDILFGDEGKDKIYGGDEDDLLFGGTEETKSFYNFYGDVSYTKSSGKDKDTLEGGKGKDIYIVTEGDIIIDFDGIVVYNGTALEIPELGRYKVVTKGKIIELAIKSGVPIADILEYNGITPDSGLVASNAEFILLPYYKSTLSIPSRTYVQNHLAYENWNFDSSSFLSYGFNSEYSLYKTSTLKSLETIAQETNSDVEDILLLNPNITESQAKGVIVIPKIDIDNREESNNTGSTGAAAPNTFYHSYATNFFITRDPNTGAPILNWETETICHFDPLVLDTNNDGVISTVALKNSDTYFDLTENGMRENTSWISSGDSFLVIDKNKNADIDSIDELFGNSEKSGFKELLETVDSNNDNLIDANDERFSELLLWNDINSNGLTEEGELSTLEDNGITSIDLNTTISNTELEGGVLKEVSQYTDSNNNTHLIGDINFEANVSITQTYIGNNEEYEIDIDSLDLPSLRGYGFISNTFISYNRNIELKNLAFELIEDVSKISNNFEEFILHWSGYENLKKSLKEKYSIENNFDLSEIEKRVWIIEKFTGDITFSEEIEIRFDKLAQEQKKYEDGIVNKVEISETTVPYDIDEINRVYSVDIVSRYEALFAAQSIYSVLYQGLYYDTYSDRFLSSDVGTFYTNISIYLNSDYYSIEDKLYLIKVSNRLNERFFPIDKEQIISAIDDENIKSLSNKIYNGKELTIMKNENSIIDLADGNNLYVYNREDGKHTIIDRSGDDTIIFGSDITIDDLVIKRVENNLIIALKEDGVEFELLKDSITINDYSNNDYKIENIVFANAETINIEEYLNSQQGSGISLSSLEVILQEDNNISGSFEVEGNTTGMQFNIDSELRNATLIIDEFGSFTYTPDENYNGIDEVIISVTNENGETSVATITFKVEAVNDAPTVNFPLEEITLTQELTKSGQIQASDIDDDVLTYTIVENAKHGEFKVDENGIWKYNVDSTYSGEDSVIVQIDDLNGGIVTKTLNFNVDNNVKNGDDRTNFLFGNNEKNILNGLGGDDFIFALRGDDMILGGEGNDIIFAAQGDDMIWGGKGDDILQGHTGNDTYIFNIGDGNDIIFEYKSRNSSDINRILFGENITAENIKFVKDNNNLIIKVSENDSIKIMNWYTNQDNISEIVFDDGTKLLNSEILEKVALEGTSRKDTLRGTNTEDNMYALEGDDRVYGYGGNDLLNGGKGDDYLSGGDGDDIYCFSLGDGNDTIVEEGNIFNWNNDNKNDTVQFDNTISATDILFTWDRNNLIINYSDNDSIKIDNQKRGYKDIENFKLSDGSYLTNDDVEILIQNMTSFAAENDIDLTNRNEVKNNSELMNIVTNAWHHAS